MSGLENKLDFKSTMFSFIPTTLIGAGTMGYVQYMSSQSTDSIELAILAGLGAQTIARSLTILPSHALLSRARLKKAEGSYEIGKYTQEMVAIASSAKILYAPFLASLTAIDTYLLSQGASHFEAGSCASLTSGLVYATVLSLCSPKINAGVDKVKGFVKKKLKK
jgi:hypothetical protein